MATAGFKRNLSFLLYCVTTVFIMLLLPVESNEDLNINNEACPVGCSCVGFEVNCSNRGFVTVPSDLPSWTRELDLSRNQLENFDPNVFSRLTLLEELNLDYNSLTVLDTISRLEHLSTLIVSHNNIRVISQKFLPNLPALRVLDLSHNRLVHIFNTTFPYESQIVSLFLNNNRILNLEKGCFDNLTFLETLRLNKNRLQEVPKDLNKLKHLKTLLLNQNRIAKIESLTFKGLNSLENLTLHKNVISDLQDGAFWELSNMKRLRLDYNNITEIASGWLYGLTSLEYLTLKYNEIVEIKENSWEFCGRLSYLDISYNYLQSLPKGAFLKLPRLSFLILDHNNISLIESGAFKGLSQVQKLILDHNHISWTIEDMTGAFMGLDKLHTLSLASNLIKSIAKFAFKGLEELVFLNLSSNAIIWVQDNAFSGMKSLKELMMDSSSLLCDCHIQWFPAWLNSVGFNISATCAHPERVKGQSIFNGNVDEFTCDDIPRPSFLEQPQTQIVLKGDNISLVCKSRSSSTSDVTFQWKRDNIVLHNAIVENFAQAADEEITIYSTTLKIYNISNSDEGRYQCVISNEFGAAYSQKAKITVHVFPIFTKTPTDVTVKAGNPARLECAAEGFPPPQIAWQKDGGDDFPAARERRMHVMPSDEVFFIVNVKAADMGTYSCTAQNTAGLVMANFTLTVLEVPTFVKPMEDKEAPVGKTAVLECMASGSPKPKLTWSKDGVVLGTTDRYYFTANDQLLVIVQTQLTDTGVYSCMISNPLGTERSNAFLKVVSSELSDESMTGIIVISVVCCVVGTSLIWVVIIYKTRKRRDDYLPNSGTDINLPPELAGYSACVVPCIDDTKGCATHIFTDDNSEHSSKDSGNGDSVKRSCENLSADIENGRESAAGGSQRLIRIQAEDSSSTCILQGNCESSMESIQSSPGAHITSSSSGGRPRGSSDPTFRTFLIRPSNHDRTESDICELDASMPLLCDESQIMASQQSQSQYNIELPIESEHQPSKVYAHPTQNVNDGLWNSSNSYATFPRSVSSLHKRSSTTLPTARSPQEVQNDSGSFSIASNASVGNVEGAASACNAPPTSDDYLESSIYYGKISLPNLTRVDREYHADSGARQRMTLPTAV